MVQKLLDQQTFVPSKNSKKFEEDIKYDLQIYFMSNDLDRSSSLLNLRYKDKAREIFILHEHHNITLVLNSHFYSKKLMKDKNRF
jgi:hypothetical protein